MKPRTWGALVVVSGTMAAIAVHGAESNEGDIGLRIRRYCDPVCQLKVQDSAFALLLETYREFHSYQIENDYQGRLYAAVSLPAERGGLVLEDNSPVMRTLRDFVVGLAGQERSLRYARLQVQAVNLQTAYNCARRQDERATGQTVQYQASADAAREKLKEFVIVAPGSLTSGNLKVGKEVPAAAVLLPKQPVRLLPGQTVEPCQPGDEPVEIDPPSPAPPVTPAKPVNLVPPPKPQ